VRIHLEQAELDYLARIGPVKFSVDPDWEPYELIDPQGRFVGIAADLFRLIVERLGLDVRLVATSTWKESIAAVRSGASDLLVFLNPSPERSEWLSFTSPYFTDPNVFITRNEHEFIYAPERLSGSSIVFPEGTSLEERVRKRYPNLRIIVVASEAEALALVEAKKADMTLRSLTMAAYTIRKNGLFNLKVAGQLPDDINRFSIGVSKELAPLREILDKGVRSISPQDVERIVNRHIAIQVQTAVDYGLLLRVVASFLIILSMGVYLIRRQRAYSMHLRTIIDAVPGYSFAKDSAGKYLMVNKSAATLFGLEPEQVVGKTDRDYGAGADLIEVDLEADRRVLETGKPLFIAEHRALRLDRTVGWFQTTKIPYRSPDSKKPAVLGVSIDITDRKALEAELERQASTDALTGIANRRRFFAEAEREFALSRRHGQALAAMMIDIDHFKKINDAFGHHAGDEVLREAACSFSGSIREGDLLGRIGGEEFAVILPQTDEPGAVALAERLRENLALLRVRGDWRGEITFTVSVGVSVAKADEASIEAALARADEALYEAKKAGRNRVELSRKSGAEHSGAPAES